MFCESFVEHIVVFSIGLTTEVVPMIFPNLNVVDHLAVPAGWGSCLPRLAIFLLVTSSWENDYNTYFYKQGRKGFRSTSARCKAIRAMSSALKQSPIPVLT